MHIEEDSVKLSNSFIQNCELMLRNKSNTQHYYSNVEKILDNNNIDWSILEDMLFSLNAIRNTETTQTDTDFKIRVELQQII